MVSVEKKGKEKRGCEFEKLSQRIGFVLLSRQYPLSSVVCKFQLHTSFGRAVRRLEPGRVRSSARFDHEFSRYTHRYTVEASPAPIDCCLFGASLCMH